ncbi:MAG: hypothetical protein JST59_07615 [Actinobacteria bacterium]|nr:hypothetical protein [Actinomycetota bacterium]
MTRRLVVLALAMSAILAYGAPSAGATVFGKTEWDVSIDGKQTVRWSFAAEKADTCTSYYGSPSEEAVGSGSISMSFATKKKQPLWAETYLSGHTLKFMSFATEGWKIPAVFTKQGKFSVTPGMPCGLKPGEEPLSPLPRTSDTSECGTVNATMDPSLYWERGKFMLLGGLESTFLPERCPGPFELEMWVDAEGPCIPKEGSSGLEGSPLRYLDVNLPSKEFLKGKAFDVSANEKFQCEFPSRWEGEPPLKVLLHTKYNVTFKPRRD